MAPDRSTAPTRHRPATVVVAAAALCTVLLASAFSGRASAQSASSVSASPSTVAADGTVAVSADLAGACVRSDNTVPLKIHPTGSAASSGWVGSLAVTYGVPTHGRFGGSTSVPVSTLLGSNSARGSWTVMIDCVDTADVPTDTFTIESLPTTTAAPTTTAPTTTAAPTTAPTTTWPSTTTAPSRYTGQTTTNENTRFELVGGTWGKIVLSTDTTCTITTNYVGGRTADSSTDCVQQRQLVYVSGQNEIFAPGTEIVLWIFSDPVRVGSTTANAKGGFDPVSIRIPNVPPGKHQLRAVGTAPDGKPITYALPIVVEADPAGELAFTGTTDQTPWLAIGGLLAIVAGIGLVFATVRPEPIVADLKYLRPLQPIELRGSRRRRDRRR